MIKRFFTALFVFTAFNVSAQRYSHYFTNTLYESFENPSTGVFTPDSSRMYAFNFLAPNFTTNLWLTGKTQVPLKQYLFLGKSDNVGLSVGNTNANRLNFNGNFYWLMLKIFASLNGKQEIGFSAQTRGEGKAYFTDESIALFDGGSIFADGSYNNLFNDNYRYQTYHQFSLTYRREANRWTAWGIKLSALSGIAYNRLQIAQSNVTFDKESNRMFVSLAGKFSTNIDPGTFSTGDVLPTFQNPGLSLTFGITQKTEQGYQFQYNLKDLGFIRWGSQSDVYSFNDSRVVQNLTSSHVANDLINAARNIIQSSGTHKAFVTPTDGRFELSVARTWWFDDEKRYRYMPIVVLSKQLFNNGFTGVLVNDVQYKNLTLSLTTAYNDMRQLSLGGQLMIKSPNTEFFIGCEQLYPAYNIAEAALGSNTAVNTATPYTAVGLFVGFSIKFGPEIETPPNASHVPMDRGGILSRIFH